MLDPESEFQPPIGGGVAPAEPVFAAGDHVYITPVGHEWITRSQKYQGSRLILAGRSAVIQDVYDWDSERGKKVLENREKNGKWIGLDSKEFKYIVLLLFPELPMDGKVGVGMPEVLPYFHPKLRDPLQPLFEKYPEHLHDLITGKRKL